MLTRPFTRLVVAFGQRKVTQRRLVEEWILGCLVLIPLGLVVGLLTSRLCTKFHFSAIRSDIWTTVVGFLVGDVLMEWLLPSLSCLPMPGVDWDGEYYYSVEWLLQSYGIHCPPDFASSTTLLSPDATAVFFSLRLVFLCIGVHLGESLCFIALTGGIASGKSTVSQMLVDFNNTVETVTHHNKRKPKRNPTPEADEYKEGTVHLICADSIAHEILLPPWVLDETSDDQDSVDSQENNYTVHPNDSVYDKVLSTFQGHDLLDADQHIDRLKLGAIVFQHAEQRRKLNRITHPKIIQILLQQLLRGVFWSSCDMTVADLPLLFESGKLSWLFAVTICVTVPEDIQFARLCKRNPQLSKDECQARIDSQLPMTKKAALADIVIDNSGSIDDLSEKVEDVRRDLMGRLYGIGMSLLQMLLLIGGSTSIAVSSKFYAHFPENGGTYG